MASNTSRTEALRNLVELREPLPAALTRLAEFPWPSERELITLVAHDLTRALEAFDAGSLDEEGLCTWAETLQGREDIALDPADRDLLAGALFELSTPELFGSMAGVIESVKGELQRQS